MAGSQGINLSSGSDTCFSRDFILLLFLYPFQLRLNTSIYFARSRFGVCAQIIVLYLSDPSFLYLNFCWELGEVIGGAWE
jgi:hypothetical protein